MYVCTVYALILACIHCIAFIHCIYCGPANRKYQVLSLDIVFAYSLSGTFTILTSGLHADVANFTVHTKDSNHQRHRTTSQVSLTPIFSDFFNNSLSGSPALSVSGLPFSRLKCLVFSMSLFHIFSLSMSYFSMFSLSPSISFSFRICLSVHVFCRAQHDVWLSISPYQQPKSEKPLYILSLKQS